MAAVGDRSFGSDSIRTEAFGDEDPRAGLWRAAHSYVDMSCTGQTLDVRSRRGRITNGVARTNVAFCAGRESSARELSLREFLAIGAAIYSPMPPGKVMVKRAPPMTELLSAAIHPPCASTMDLDICKPIPMPPSLVVKK